jgi:hypothetical protein
LFGEKLVSFFISGALVWESMTAPVKFNRKFRDRAEEIKEVNATWIPPLLYMESKTCSYLVYDILQGQSAIIKSICQTVVSVSRKKIGGDKREKIAKLF